MIVVGTRPEIIRLSEVIKACEKYFDVVLVHTGQNYDFGLNEVFFQNFGLRAPDYCLDAPGKHLGETVGNIISRSYELIGEVKPDAFLALGDTNSCLAAYSAKRHKVPIFHMEAGNRCFDFNVPEEINRRIVDHIADINLAYTENARRYLISEGCNKDFLYVTGSPMTEVLFKNKESIEKSTILGKLAIEKGKYFVVSMHREENVDIPGKFRVLADALNAVAEKYGYPLIFSTHPRTQKRIESERISLHPLIRNLEPLGFFDYNKLQHDAYCVLSDSGTVPEEGAILNFPAVALRNSTERPEALDGGAIALGGNSKDETLNAIEIAVGMHGGRRENPVRDYLDINVSEKVVKIVQSYTGIVAKRVWGK
jgi:UDP-N-acetylglucosamine 2-epimerase (non-hydrolysing)